MALLVTVSMAQAFACMFELAKARSRHAEKFLSSRLLMNGGRAHAGPICFRDWL